MPENRRPKLYFSMPEDGERPHELGFILSIDNRQFARLLSTIGEGISRDDVKRDRVCLTVTGIFEKLTKDGSYKPVNLSFLDLTP